MGADLIVVLPPSGDSHLGVHAIPKPLQRQKLIAELTVERFVGAILPRLAGIDERGVEGRLRFAEAT